MLFRSDDSASNAYGDRCVDDPCDDDPCDDDPCDDDPCDDDPCNDDPCDDPCEPCSICVEAQICNSVMPCTHSTIARDPTVSLRTSKSSRPDAPTCMPWTQVLDSLLEDAPPTIHEQFVNMLLPPPPTGEDGELDFDIYKRIAESKRMLQEHLDAVAGLRDMALKTTRMLREVLDHVDRNCTALQQATQIFARRGKTALDKIDMDIYNSDTLLRQQVEHEDGTSREHLHRAKQSDASNHVETNMRRTMSRAHRRLLGYEQQASDGYNNVWA